MVSDSDLRRIHHCVAGLCGSPQVGHYDSGAVAEVNFADSFAYDLESKTFLSRTVPAYCGKDHNRVIADVGPTSDIPAKTGYYVVFFNGKRHCCHRIIWVLHFGSIPDGMVIDHIDGNKLNNRLENLRAVSQAMNMRNQTKPAKSGGKRGVTRQTIRRANGSSDDYWTARWVDLNGKDHGRMFNIKRYGEDGAKLLALECRKEMMELLNSQGAGYTEAHNG